MSEEITYAFAENLSKLKRAITEVEASGKKYKSDEEKEEAVKLVYRRLLGRVIGEPARGAAVDSVELTEERLEAAREEGREEIRKENADPKSPQNIPEDKKEDK